MHARRGFASFVPGQIILRSNSASIGKLRIALPDQLLQVILHRF